jgi:hypothetical protein
VTVCLISGHRMTGSRVYVSALGRSAHSFIKAVCVTYLTACKCEHPGTLLPVTFIRNIQVELSHVVD